MPVWMVLCPIIPGTRHWRGLMSSVVAIPYVALTTVQTYKPVLPHNSIRGLHYYAMGAHAPKPASYSKCRCYKFKLCALESGFTHMGVLH